MYKCVEAASEAEAVAFLSRPTELTLMTTTVTNNPSGCDSGVQEVTASASVCEANTPARRRETASAYLIQSCNSTHTLYYGCNDMFCGDCTLTDAVGTLCIFSAP